MSLPYLKGKRTRYRNLLEKELSVGRNLLAVDPGTLDLKDYANEVDECVKRLNDFTEKLDVSCETLSMEIRDSEDKDKYEQLINDDNSFITTVIDCRGELEKCRRSIEDLMVPSGAGAPVTITEEQTCLSQVVQLQAQMQQLMLHQQERYQQERESSEARQQHLQCSSVKLPRLEIPFFNGDKLKWSEFWDSFEATVDKNSVLSNIEKLSYLTSKLTGEAKHAVSGILLSNENYYVAKTILKERFGDSQCVVNSHYAELINMKPAINSSKGLRSLYDELEKHFRSLEALQQDTDQDVFISMITSKIPKEVLLQLEIQKGARNNWTVGKLRQLLNDYISAREKTDQQSHTRVTENYHTEVKSPRMSAEALVAGFRAPNKQNERNKISGSCRFCEGRHWSDECKRFASMEERKRRIKGSCFICLKQGHKAGECGLNKSCYHCGQINNHHRSLCPQKFGSNNAEGVHLAEELLTEEYGSNNENALLSSSEIVLMQTATADITNQVSGQIQNVRMLFDTGSQRTYITEALAKKLNLQMGPVSEILLVTFGSEKPKRIRTPTTKIGIMLKGGSILNISANVVPNITGSIQRCPIQCKSLRHWEHLWNESNLADSFPTEKETTSIELLIGNDYYLDLILPQKVEVQPGLYMLASKLGWILTGRTTELAKDTTESSMLILTYGMDIPKQTSLLTMTDLSLPTKPNLEDFWKLESIGITDSLVNSDDKRALKTFNDTLKYENNRYFVTWPWKEEIFDLPENRELAVGRLKSLLNKLRKTPELIEKYNDIIENQLKLGVIEKVKNDRTDTRKHYIPHHAVLNPEKTSTKLRVVYDASAKTKKENKSLNECLYRGPTMLQDLTGILLRFRLNKIAITADIEKAFLQIGLMEDAKDVTRFFWLKNKKFLTTENNIQVYRFNRVPFGIISSPFLLSATTDYHLRGYKIPEAEMVRENIYVDNVITGKSTRQGAIDFYEKVKQIFREASMNLRDWMSNDDSVINKIPIKDRAPSGPMKILGLTWIVRDDMLSLSRRTQVHTTSKLSKRVVLKQVASIYDPLGFFSPVTLLGKIFLQTLWNQKLSWDDQLSAQDQLRWMTVETDLKQISDCAFPRYIGLSDPCGKGYQLLVFCDASQLAYAATVYLRQEADGKCVNSLIFSKTRLVPNKDISIPRLELMAALIGVRCMRFVEKELKLEMEQKHIWLDSQCVLNWIHSQKVFTTFVENRLREIRECSDVTFHYISSSENPADFASRGMKTIDLRDNYLWWHGPEWVLSPSENWPVWKSNNQDTEINTQTEAEVKTTKVMYEAKLVAAEVLNKNQEISTKVNAPLDIDIHRFSSLTKMLRVTALALRFINNLKRTTRSSSSLDTEEINQAEQLWTRYVQRVHFHDVIDSINNNKRNNMKTQLGIYLDNKKILRCRGRLENANISEGAKLPILLPKNDRYTQLLIERTHKNSLHTGVGQTLALLRQKYWIPQGRCAVKSILSKCVVCRHYEGGPYKMPIMPPLPNKRVAQSQPFTQSGVDYFGPLFIKEKTGTKKVWGCLYTCLVTRAIHLELISDMSAEQFLLGFRRFLARHGKPKEIISDNASQFKLAAETIDKFWSQTLTEKEVLSYVANENIKWKFIVELAPWMGGFYERLIGLVKRSLRKAIGKLCLTYEQLLTILKEAEAVVNSRPIVYIGDDINSNIALTPSHFLTLNPNIGIPAYSDTDSDDDDFIATNIPAEKLLLIWKKGLKHTERFWKIWRDEYLLSLRERTQTRLKESKRRSKYSAQVGDVVLIKDNLPRGTWRLGKIIELIECTDQQVRAAKILLPSKRTISRPLNLLFPIECPLENENICDQKEDNQKPVHDPAKEQIVPQRTKRGAAERAEIRIREQLKH